jgi:hypothetical protein
MIKKLLIISVSTLILIALPYPSYPSTQQTQKQIFSINDDPLRNSIAHIKKKKLNEKRIKDEKKKKKKEKEKEEKRRKRN